ncbi:MULTISPECIES: DUF1837 domain-containing protein [unclassified Paenibacillus]|uniref:HamA C-terminal domain-containing protein n=1 Tax=unclassified Paenibacillus TaxID=185978 RepID=UPI0024065858|nr:MULTISPECIES: DUF1837 domain-containing protein [unclassified Paenibacillus]MDF9841474.1 hypothetical protein [Paenibacillus sp. PastF-2]MDF9848064.1 hypothetical protein [Paenibacillus sp. PastM-2]
MEVDVLLNQFSPHVDENFLDLFYHEIQSFELDGSNTKINLHTLKIENNIFVYSELVEKLFDCIVTYCLSRKELEIYKNNKGIYVKAIQRLRKWENNDGELGEVLLYCFLESHLRAPKIFTKMELKTSPNDYVKGSDGVHVLQVDKNNFQLIFGESKLEKTFQRCLYDAFNSINDFITRNTNNIHDEIRLLNTHLEKESISPALYNVLKKIIIPSAREEEIFKDNAFGIFAGFEITVDEDSRKLSNSEFRKMIRAKIKSEVESQYSYIQKKIDEHKLYGTTFYVYAFPFVEISNTRKRIIRNLMEATNDF